MAVTCRSRFSFGCRNGGGEKAARYISIVARLRLAVGSAAVPLRGRFGEGTALQEYTWTGEGGGVQSYLPT